MNARSHTFEMVSHISGVKFLINVIFTRQLLIAIYNLVLTYLVLFSYF